MTYNTRHITDLEVNRICAAIQREITAKIGMRDEPNPENLLDAPLEELQEEYDFWAKENEKRIKSARGFQEINA